MKLEPGQLKVGPWMIQEESPPIPCWVFSAVHDDYDGPEDNRSLWSALPRHTGMMGRLVALRRLVSQVIDYEKENE